MKQESRGLWKEKKHVSVMSTLHREADFVFVSLVLVNLVLNMF